MRGSDIDYNPVFFAYVIITLDEIHLFLQNSQLPSNHQEHFKTNNVKVIIHKYEQMQQVLKTLVNDVKTTRVWISSTSSYALSALVPFKRLVQEVRVCIFKMLVFGLGFLLNLLTNEKYRFHLYAS